MALQNQTGNFQTSQTLETFGFLPKFDMNEIQAQIAYIIANCEARAFIADTRFAATCAEAAEESPKAAVRLAIGGEIPGFEPYEVALAAQSGDDIEDPSLGGAMLPRK